MFFRKKRPVTVLTVEDAAGNRLLECPLADLPLPEPAVLALSIEYFNDPEPCEIHRAAVQKRAMMELSELPRGERVPLSALSELKRTYFPEGAAAIRLSEVLP